MGANAFRRVLGRSPHPRAPLEAARKKLIRSDPLGQKTPHLTSKATRWTEIFGQLRAPRANLSEDPAKLGESRRPNCVSVPSDHAVQASLWELHLEQTPALRQGAGDASSPQLTTHRPWQAPARIRIRKTSRGTDFGRCRKRKAPNEKNREDYRFFRGM